MKITMYLAVGLLAFIAGIIVTWFNMLFYQSIGLFVLGLIAGLVIAGSVE